MAKFKEGDKVRRTHNAWCGMNIGDTDIVHSCGSINVELLKYGQGHTTNNFELVEPEVDVAAERKATPVFSGVLKYFPDALQAVAQCSKVGNDQHNPGEPLHWARGKSGDELDALTRHLLDAGTMDTDGIRHSTKVAWRALANLQKELEKAGEADVPTVDINS